VNIQSCSLRDEVITAAALLRAGKTVAFPTETVYGLGADAGNSTAVRRVFEIKGRPLGHPLIIHIAGAGDIETWAKDVPDMAFRLAERFWPGPLTLVLRRKAWVPDLVTGAQDGVALRVPLHPVALALLRAFGGGVAAPSANRFGGVSPTEARHVFEELGGKVDLILDGGSCAIGIESTILSLIETMPTILRPGGLPVTALTEAIGMQPALALSSGQSIRCPGMLPRHYAPRTMMEAEPSEAIWDRCCELEAAGERVGVLALTDPLAQSAIQRQTTVVVVMPPDPPGYARRLYTALRRLDSEGLDRLLVERPPMNFEWLAVNDRLRRATQVWRE